MTKNFDSEYEIQQNILIKLGGDGTKCFDSQYSILLEILDKIEGGGGGAQIDDYVKLSILTQAQYDALTTKDASTLYIISDAQ